jgi:hypothetical protein
MLEEQRRAEKAANERVGAISTSKLYYVYLQVQNMLLSDTTVHNSDKH